MCTKYKKAWRVKPPDFVNYVVKNKAWRAFSRQTSRLIKKAWRRPTLPHVHHAVPSALKGLTSVFGMGTGVPPSLLSPGKLIAFFKELAMLILNLRTIRISKLSEAVLFSG
jgi:hypothetical protein